ncbi:MAG TPA: hypothetical protein VH008_20470 [Pseudonocardia sp.]|jgi:hypothetical protein|nr:hypothetical protein [Pseudonocardia sp.]
MAADRTTSNARPPDQQAAHRQAADLEAADRVVAARKAEAREATLWAELANNAVVLSNATEERSRLLVARARLWDQLAELSSPACGRAYRDAAAKCRAEAAGDRVGAEPEPAG